MVSFVKEPSLIVGVVVWFFIGWLSGYLPAGPVPELDALARVSIGDNGSGVFAAFEVCVDFEAVDAAIPVVGPEHLGPIVEHGNAIIHPSVYAIRGVVPQEGVPAGTFP
jgi:hypothetical protein